MQTTPEEVICTKKKTIFIINLIMAQSQKNNNSSSEGAMLTRRERLENHGFFRIYKFLIKDLKISITDAFIYGYLDELSRSDKIVQIYVSVARIASELNLSESTVHRSLRILKKRNLVFITYRSGQTSLWTVNDEILKLYDNEGNKITSVDKSTKIVDNYVDKSVDNQEDPCQNDTPTQLKMTPPPCQNDTQLKEAIKNNYKNKEEGILNFRIKGTRFRKSRKIQSIGEALKEVKEDMKRQGVILKESKHTDNDG